MREQAFKEALTCVSERQFNEAVKQLQTILEDETRDDTYFKALKLYADILGPITKTDLFLSIDMYQTIINECESDELYVSSQLAQLEAQLTISIHFMENYESTVNVIEDNDDFANDELERLDKMREKFILSRAESIYKNRM